MFGTKPFEQSPTSPFGLQQSFGSSAYETPGPSPLSCSSSPAFGSTGQIFGHTSGVAFGQSSSPFETTILSFGSPTTPSGFTVTVTFVDPSAPSFGAAISLPSGAQITFSRSHASTPSSGGQSVFGGQQGGSRVSPYSSTPYIDGSFTWKLLSLSAMPVYERKSHEEFRWKDYQFGVKGSPSPASQLITAVTFGQSPTTSSNFFSSSNPLSPEVTRNSPFGSSSTSAYCLSHFGTSNASNNFSPTSFPPSLFGSKSQTSAFGSPKFHFGTSEQGTTSASGAGFNFGNTRSSFIFQSSAEPAFTSTSSPCGQTTSSTFCQTCSVFGKSNLSSTTPSSTFGGSMISSGSFLPSNINHIVFGQTAPSLATPFQQLQLSHSCGCFSFKNTGQSQEAPTSGFGGASGLCGQSASGEDVKTLEGHRAGKASIVHKHEADIEALMPKLRHSDYYTEPRLQEIAAKERAEQGYCRHVKDFVVGRHGYGSIKFFDETDVRRLDLESIVQFNNREVIVYADDSEEVPVGQGLNKPAEVTLLNVKCVDKTSGKQCTDGAKLERFEEMLRKKAEGQGAEFVSYDPVKGEWKFRVQHFSRYELGEEDDCD